MTSTATPSPPQASRFGSGQAVPRLEDAQLLRGEGRYVDDFAPDGLAHLVFVRSPHAHARLRGVDADAARALPGVLRLSSTLVMRQVVDRPLPLWRRRR